MEPAYIASWVWAALEIGLVIRDRWRRRGSTARDGGTRRSIMLIVAVAMAGAVAVAVALPSDSALRLPGAGSTSWSAGAGVAVMTVGLLLRVWAIAVLGHRFRTTVEVDPDQAVVDRGPYRWARHPSYTGVLLVATGLGLAMANWISLAVAVVLPLIVIQQRITGGARHDRDPGPGLRDLPVSYRAPGARPVVTTPRPPSARAGPPGGFIGCARPA